MKAIFLNGPPRAGKDTIGSMLAASLPDSGQIKFAQPIIEHMQETFGVSCVDGFPKDEPCPELGGRTRREVAIAYSEGYMKPMFGKAIFGKIAADQILSWNELDGTTTFIFTDSGFLDEAQPVIDSLGLESCFNISVFRPGCTFDGDSRSFWSVPGIRRLEVHNHGSQGDLFNDVRSRVVPEIERWSRP